VRNRQKILGVYADRGLLRLGRRKLTILDAASPPRAETHQPVRRAPTILKSTHGPLRRSSVGPTP
jgi:hypothetical protein